MTKSEFLNEISEARNIVPVTTLEFASGVTTVVDSNLRFGGLDVTTIILASTVTSHPNWVTNSWDDPITVIQN